MVDDALYNQVREGTERVMTVSVRFASRSRNFAQLFVIYVRIVFLLIIAVSFISTISTT